MKLFEIFNDTQDWNWLSQTNDRWIAEAEVDKYTYRITFNDISEDELRNHWGVTRPVENSWWVMFQLYSFEGKTLNDYGITGTGNELQVFSTVLDVMKDFADRHSPGAFGFSAHESSRIKLYNKIMSRFSRNGRANRNDQGETVYYVTF